MRDTPLLLSAIVGLLLGLIALGGWRVAARRAGAAVTAQHDDMLVWMLALAAFTVGAFLTYVVLKP